jgi:hypothetical protein
MLHNQPRPVNAQQLFYDQKMESGTQIIVSYPRDTKAFLYYSTPPEGLRIAGELRFRVTSCDDPASFDSGSDLMKPNGQLWSRQLSILRISYKSLYGKLREEGLVPDDLDAVLSTRTSRISKYQHQGQQLLNTINDTFIVDFSIHPPDFCVITEHGAEILPFAVPTNQARGGGRRRKPYTGAYYTNHQLSILLD